MPNIFANNYRGTQLGFLEFQICNNRNELEQRHDFRSSIHSLENCLLRVDQKEEYPIAFLKIIRIKKKYRKRHYGSLLLNTFEEVTKEKACKLAFCRVGWTAGETTREENISFYEKNAWSLYEPSSHDLVMAFKSLRSCSFPHERNEQNGVKTVVDWSDASFRDPIAPKRM